MEKNLIATATSKLAVVIKNPIIAAMVKTPMKIGANGKLVLGKQPLRRKMGNSKQRRAHGGRKTKMLALVKQPSKKKQKKIEADRHHRQREK